jgi:hypothetical protein
MIIFNTVRKSGQTRDPRIVHIDEWQSLADKHREDVLGTNFFEDTKSLFTMSQNQVAPRFRPAVSIPELQMMCMKEANDLSEFQPQAYIYNQTSDKRVESIETAFRAQWNRMFIPFHLLFAFVAMEFMGTGFLHFGIDPFARNGRGQMWTKWRESKSVHSDPNADYTCNWSFLIVDDWVHLDEVKRRFPERAKFLPKSPGRPQDVRSDTAGSGFQLPPGPWTAMPPFSGLSSAMRGSASRVRTCYALDYSREMIGELPADPDVPARYRWKYPRGRVVVDCEDVVLADGQCPFRKMPLVPVWATPPLYGTWAIPPTRYTIGLQNLAERLYSQTFENFYRLNNGIWLLPAAAQIEQGKFGGIPGEKCTYEGNQPPTLVTPPAFPQGSLDFPERLLTKQKELHGFTQARQGNPGSGNLSAELFDAAVLRGQSMTQLRGRLASMSVLQLTELIVYTMMEFMPSQKMAWKDGSEFSLVNYEQPKDGVEDYEMFLDDGSFHVKSQAIVSKIAENLMARGQLPVGTGLEMLGYPNADKVQKDLQTQQALTAVSTVVEGRGKK